ncbi:outer membrane scaffolding protein for murein synthesis (MipA/OmpV family) [Humitalea rosea]|uniref:Outer membrane scaffolding protein for murein synthesis (MipA/OmpV family) n=1 Tax=Humitalea rosea TaxID=990373 RepID=A0A2W7JAM5_9PROT|nr:MipA/OmpV family protein [Humitalea rosea]PZW49195.1 outer membrane scaffolding protein for murein synthesis (MipA/OmpV family) [Humitalea rosea]
MLPRATLLLALLAVVPAHAEDALPAHAEDALPAHAEDALPAHAEDALPALSLSLGGGVAASPAYRGGGAVRLSPSPYVSGSIGEALEVDSLDGVRLRLLHLEGLNLGGLSAGAFGRYSAGRSVHDLPARLRGLGGLGDTVELGGYVTYEAGPLTLDTIAVQDATRGGGGAALESRLTLGIPIGDPARQQGFEIGPFVQLADRAGLRRDFGVDAAQSAATGLAAFSPRAGAGMAGIEGFASLPLAAGWSLRGFVQWGRLVGDAAASPIVRGGGAREQLSGGAFLVFTPWGPAR